MSQIDSIIVEELKNMNVQAEAHNLGDRPTSDDVAPLDSSDNTRNSNAKIHPE